MSAPNSWMRLASDQVNSYDHLPFPLGLDKHFENAAHKDQPEHDIVLLGSQPGRHDELARAKDRGGQVQPRSDLTEFLDHGDRGVLDYLLGIAC